MTRSGAASESIKLTGMVLNWDDPLEESFGIAASEKRKYQRRGYTCIEFQDGYIAMKPIVPPDGDIVIQQKSDMLGRFSQRGGHANFGYSGYFVGYIYLGGKRKKLADWWTLFPGEEHHFKAQKDRPETIERIETRIRSMVGQAVSKVKGGYAFDPIAHDLRQARKSGVQ